MNEVKKGADGVFDFDAIVLEPRMARVGGEEANVAMIPVAVAWKLAKLSERTTEEIMKLAEEDPIGEFQRMVQLVADVCTQSNPKMTAEFLTKHLDQVRLTAFFKFVFEPTRKRAEEVEGEVPAVK